LKMKIKQIWIPYTEWEDWKNGMWRKLPKEDEGTFLKMAINFTADHVRYGLAMREVNKSWPKTMLNSLTNPSINKRAFLGHCAVQFKIGVPEYITRMAWRELTERQRVDADAEAQQTIDEWYEREARGIHKHLGKQMLLRWDS
jgi:hypothetical protein